MQYEAAMYSDKGLVRHNNEDSCFIFDTSQQIDLSSISYGLYIVADGMGGHQAGEVASRKAIQIIQSVLMEDIAHTLNSNVNILIQEAFAKANTEIYNAALNNPHLSGMGTTATLGFRMNDILYIGHVGDSRVYLIRDRNIIQLTLDHSLVESLKNSGLLTEEESRSYPDRNIILRALGTSENIIVDSSKESTGEESIPLGKDDHLVFCTDGLTNAVDDQEIVKTVTGTSSALDACKKLVEIANSRGGNDNTTVIVVHSL